MNDNLDELIKYKNIGAGIAAALSLLALADWPYGYYTFLRLVVSVAAGLIIYTANKLQKVTWVVIGSAPLLLWNPLIPVHLDRETWQPLNILAAALLVAAVFVVKPKSAK